MARPNPYRNFRFRVKIDGFTVAGFTRVSGLEQDTEVIRYREGGDNRTTRKLIGQTDFSPIILERGVSIDIDFYTWAAAAVFNVLADVVPEGLIKQSITIELLDKELTVRGTPKVAKTWIVFRCWPSNYSQGDFDSMTSGVLIERLTLQNEGFVVEPQI